jgi:predicted metalloprotease
MRVETNHICDGNLAELVAFLERELDRSNERVKQRVDDAGRICGREAAAEAYRLAILEEHATRMRILDQLGRIRARCLTTITIYP